MSIYDKGPCIFLPRISSSRNLGCLATPALFGKIKCEYRFLLALKIVSSDGVAEPNMAETLSFFARTTSRSRAEY